MRFSTSDATVVDPTTGNRKHQDTAPVPSAVSAEDTNMVIWSLMKVVQTGGATPAAFDPTNAATYSVLLTALQAMFGQVLATSGVPYGFKIGAVTVQFGTTATIALDTVSGVISFPVAFSTACLVVLVTPSTDRGVNPSGGNYSPGIFNKTASGFQINNDSFATTFDFIAIGY